MDDFHVSWVFLIPIVSIIGSFTYVIVLTLEPGARARARSPRADRHDRARPGPRARKSTRAGSIARCGGWTGTSIATAPGVISALASR